jgi:hypothetical protein
VAIITSSSLPHGHVAPVVAPSLGPTCMSPFPLFLSLALACSFYRLSLEVVQQILARVYMRIMYYPLSFRLAFSLFGRVITRLTRVSGHLSFPYTILPPRPSLVS